jgi:two-component system, NtrC family, nitrogen regulation sensor histidine kinase NtrY
MLKRISIVLAAILLIASVTLVLWQGSFNTGSYVRPDDPQETFLFFGLQILIFLLMLGLGFMLIRLMIKLWVAKQVDRHGSRIRTRLVIGALALSAMPVIFMVLFNYEVLGATLTRVFSAPFEHVKGDFTAIGEALQDQTKRRALAEAQLIAASGETETLLNDPGSASGWLAAFCSQHSLLAVRILPVGSMTPIAAFGDMPATMSGTGIAPIRRNGRDIGSVYVAAAVPVDVINMQEEIHKHISVYEQLHAKQGKLRTTLLQLQWLIALFILVVATWLADYVARQISTPIAALLKAAEEVSRGNLTHRVAATGIDELAVLISGFNRMTADLEANRSELESRRRFTEAILESIPTGVISVDSSGLIQRVNKALTQMLPETRGRGASRLDNLFPPEDATEIRYLMNRARRTGLSSRQFEVHTPSKTLHLAITVAAIEGGRSAGFVVVIEDTSDLLRAQKVAAWSEVARRVAHEIRNPLTPITLSAERIVRQANRTTLPEAVDRVLRECASTILDETASVKRLVDEFSQFSRLPAAQLVLCDLNEVVANGIGVFEGRLEGIELTIDLSAGLPPVMADPEQLKRVVVNLIDNAAEAMQDSPVKILVVQTQSGSADSVEIVVADSGCGVTADEKEKLFLPYFSTKGRGTGLGLAIVSHILTEHEATIRVEDNKPSGARFTIEMPGIAEVPGTTAADDVAVAAVPQVVTAS